MHRTDSEFSNSELSTGKTNLVDAELIHGQTYSRSSSITLGVQLTGEMLVASI